MPRLSSLVLKTLAGLGITLPAGGIFGDWSLASQQAKILSSDINGSDELGTSVSISSDGNTAIVGAQGHGYYVGGSGLYGAGGAYIFVRSGSTWTQQAKIMASDAQGGDNFGRSVSISSDGNTAIVGAWQEDTGAAGAGAAYIFVRSGSTWTQQAKIQASDVQTNDYLGISVSISSDGNAAIVGSYWEDTGGTDSGAAYIFVRSGSTWTQQAKILGSDTSGVDWFGKSVSISGDGNTAIVGSPQEDTGAADAGAAYIFVRSGSTWAEQAKIQASDLQLSAEFGISVSISSDGNAAIVGAYKQNTGSTDDGAAYVFVRSGTSWTQQAKIQATDKEADDYFGISVSISSDGNTVVVGSPQEDTGGGNAGAAYIFTSSGSTWAQQAKIQASDKGAGDQFGYSVSISSDANSAIVGALYKNGNAGAAYIFVAG